MKRPQCWATVLVNFFALSWGGEPRLTTPFPELLVDPVPIRLDAPPVPATRVDRLEWRTSSVRYRIEVPRTPQAYARREFLCYNLTLEQGLRRLPLFEWRAAGELNSLSAPVNPRGVAVLFVGDVVGGYEFVRQIDYSPLQLQTYPPWSVEAPLFPLMPIYLRPEQLPDHPAALLGIPFIVLTDGAERLNESQQRALVLWLHAGGQLIVPLRTSASLLRRTRLAPYLPDWGELRMQRLTQPVRLHDQSARILPPSAPVPVTWLSHPRGVTLAHVGQRTLALQIPWGYGTLIVFGGDLMHPAWRNWEGHATLWKTFLHHPRFPLLTFKQLASVPKHDSTEMKRRIAAVPLLSVIFAAYGGALYALWRILRTQRRLIYAPYGVVLLSVLSVFAIHFATPPESENPSLSGTRLILGVGEHALERAEYSYRSPSGEWTLQWRPTDALAVAPVAASNPIQVAFTSEGTTLQSNSLIPTLLTLYTLTQRHAPLRIERTRTGYQLRNVSENLTFEQVQVYRYEDLNPLPADDDEMARRIKVFSTKNIAPGDTAALSNYLSGNNYLIHAIAHPSTGSSKEEVQLWLCYP